MDKIKLDEIDLKNSFFHFTDALNIDSISKYGLLPALGKNSKLFESTRKIYFSKGTDGVLKICDVWLKWLMGVMDEVNNSNQYKGQELYETTRKSARKFQSKEYLKDEAKKIDSFEKMFCDMTRRRYLILKLRDEIDFSYNDIDEIKENYLKIERNDMISLNYEYMKEFYGSYSNIDNLTVETWNMHTYIGRNILPSQITQLITEDNKEDALSLLFQIYDKSKSIDIDFDLLDDFIEWAKQRTPQEKKNVFQPKTSNHQAEEFSDLLRKNGLYSLVMKLGKETLPEQESTTDKDAVENEMLKQEHEIAYQQEYAEQLRSY